MKPSYIVFVIVLALPLLFNNCGASIVLNENGSVAMSTFPADYEAYGDHPSTKVNAIPSQTVRVPAQARTAGSGLSPTIQY